MPPAPTPVGRPQRKDAVKEPVKDESDADSEMASLNNDHDDGAQAKTLREEMQQKEPYGLVLPGPGRHQRHGRERYPWVFNTEINDLQQWNERLDNLLSVQDKKALEHDGFFFKHTTTASSSSSSITRLFKQLTVLIIQKKIPLQATYGIDHTEEDPVGATRSCAPV
ncbi:hypothetical protein BDZ89DRAFT_1040038 [Hymenopellis radicata]|nr:hypothetical protein BDZ89DRAFT_1040038 [Hymenopellis radicata]